MDTGKGFSKSNIITVVIAALVVIALVVVMIFGLKGCKDGEGLQTDAPQNTVSQDSVSNIDDKDDSTNTSSSSPTGSEKNEVKPTGNKTPESNPVQTTNKVTTYTVTFKDYDGTVLKTEKVEKGKAATAPVEPKRENFNFAGWDKSFNKVTADLVVTATYTTTKTVIYAEHVSVNKDADEVTMNIRVLNNPGIMGAVLKVSVDDKVFAFSEAKKTEYPGFTLTTPGSAITASPYTFMLDSLELSDKDKKDGTLFTVTFKIKDAAPEGKYNVALSYDDGAIFDEDYKDPKVVLENGTITIK